MGKRLPNQALHPPELSRGSLLVRQVFPSVNAERAERNEMERSRVRERWSRLDQEVTRSWAMVHSRSSFIKSLCS
jgi:hypothetical protein